MYACYRRILQLLSAESDANNADCDAGGARGHQIPAEHSAVVLLLRWPALSTVHCHGQRYVGRVLHSSNVSAMCMSKGSVLGGSATVTACCTVAVCQLCSYT